MMLKINSKSRIGKKLVIFFVTFVSALWVFFLQSTYRTNFPKEGSWHVRFVCTGSNRYRGVFVCITDIHVIPQIMRSSVKGNDW